jgi:hypothetical protein
VERSVNLAGPDERGLQRAREVGQQVGIAMDQLIHTDPRPDPTARLTSIGWAATDQSVHAAAERYHRGLTDPRLIGSVQTSAGTDRSGQGRPSAGYTMASKH